MRITRVTARPKTAPALAAAARPRESLLLILVFGLIGYGLWQVRQSREPALAAAEQRMSEGRMLVLARLTPPAEIARYLTGYDDPARRRLAARKIAELLRRGQPDNVGALARIQDGGGRLFSAEEFATRVKPNFAVRTPQEFRRAFFKWALLFFAGFLLAHLAWMGIGFRGDENILPILCFLSGAGLILMVSLRDPVRDLPVFADFAFGVLAGCLVLIASTCLAHFLNLRRQGRFPLAALDGAGAALRFIERRGEYAFALSLALGAALLVFGTGPGASGVKVRLLFFQPVELVRLLLVLFLASYFARRWEFLRELKEKRVRLGVNLPRLDHALPVMVAVALSIGFFFLQKDLGPALLLAGLFLGLYAVARARLGLVLAAAGVLAAVVWLAYRIGYPPVVVTRVGMWLAPWSNGLAHGDQLVHSLWAMATGGIAGTGLGRGMPEIIPAGHTDLILSALAEEAGFLGLLLVAGAYAVLFWRALRIAARAATAYEVFLALGLTLALALPGALIAGGITGLLPLSGVVTPLVSYGSSALVLDFLAAGILLAISAKPPRPIAALARPVMAVGAVLAVFAGVVVAKAAWVQVVKADDVVAAGALVEQEDGSYTMAYNPRLLAVARQIPRGTIYDRTGLPVATSRWEEIEKFRAAYSAAGIDVAKACSREDRRHYPFGPAMFHLLGDVRSRLRWTASNASFEERVSRSVLQGYDDRETLDTIEIPRTHRKARVYRYDYSELVPLLRARMDPNNAAVRKLLDAPREVRLTVDARFQLRLTRLFQEHLRAHGWTRGAVAVVQPATGELLAAVSLPLPSEDPEATDQPIDYARFGQYPPGSSFKLVTAVAALRRDPALEGKSYQCVRLADGRVGNTVRGRVIRDDVLDKQPHGTVDMRRALVVSCNAYFAQLGTHDVGAQALQSAAQLYNIETAHPNTPKRLGEHLPQASYGQGEVLVTPYRMARVAASLANHGELQPARFRLSPPDLAEAKPTAVLPPPLAQELATAMRGVVTSGTGREAAGAPAIAGKTGTAELAGQPAHAWFVGFAPYDAPPARRIAFAILIEHARYGGRAAAPFALKVAQVAPPATSEDLNEAPEEAADRAPAQPTGAARSSKRRPGRD